MKASLALLLVMVTAALIALGWVQSGGVTSHEISAARTPEQAVEALMADVEAHNWNRAYARLADTGTVEKQDFIRDLSGSNGSLRTYSNLQSFTVWPLHATDEDATVRVRMTWSSAIGPMDDVRDLHLRHAGDVWTIDWPKPNFPKVPPQVIPVNYLRWDVIGRNAGDEWGVENVDTPNVRITSMNAIDRPEGLVLVGEVVNEDTVPAYVSVNATLLKPDQSTLDQESSFDMIAHTLLPRQVSPYRIDFPGMRIRQVKSVRMDVKSLLVPASADPVIAVANQKLGKDALGGNVLSGDLLNQSGQNVDIAQVVAAYYDANGKVIWVSNGYVDQALVPDFPVPFAVNIPKDIAPKVESYHLVVNHYSRKNG
ncbi:MAG: hypothetical protein JO249_27065 [Acidobacteria bacterium]|nr:hypothetical protein [Acidobacteriota bacterium]MBV9484382.1 hypothetical protein [Acidobacteriota bacterium]